MYFSNRARFFQPVWRESGKRIVRAVLRVSFTASLTALVSVGIANLAGMPVEAVPQVGAGNETKTKSAAPYEWKYFPGAFAHQGAEASANYIPQFPTLTSITG